MAGLSAELGAGSAEHIGKMLPGVILPTNLTFAEVIRPLRAEVGLCYWLVDHQSGSPFDSLYVSEHAQKFEKKRLDVQIGPRSAVSCWRPHTFPRLAEHVCLDEWTQLWGIKCDEAEVSDRVKWLDAHPQLTSDAFSPMGADILLLWPDGWWEIYTSHDDWRQKLRRAFPNSYERSWRKAGEPPDLVFRI